MQKRKKNRSKKTTRRPSMVREVFYLPPQKDKKLQEDARKEGIPTSEYLRKLVGDQI